jgi:DNA (cytosine-5)-methyltransferase 1
MCLNAGGQRRLDAESETLIPTSGGGFDVAHSLRGEGFDASEDGTGRGTPLVPTVVMRESGQGYWMQDEIAGTLRAEGEDRPSRPSHVIGVPVGVLAFDPKQIAHPANFSNPKVGDPCHPLRAVANCEPAIAFTQNSRSEMRQIGGDGQVVGALAADAGAQQQNYVAFHPTQDPISSTDISHAIGTGGGRGCATAAVAFDAYNQAAAPVTHTLRKGRSATGDEIPIAFAAMQVRRLTPVECERLQGFPDNYTAIPWRGKPADQCPDGPRYKALGNSWAVPVVRWIGRRIAAAVGQ